MTGPYGTGSFGTSTFGNSPLFTTEGLIDAVLRDTGHSNPSSETNKRLAVLGFLNNRYAQVSTKRHWNWLYQTTDFLLKGPYQTGTIDVTNRSSTVTGNGTNFSANLVPNNVLVVGGRSDRYVIESVEAADSLTLEGEYAGDDATASSYMALKPIYTAPSDLEAIQSIVLGDNLGELVPLGTQEFRRKQSRDLTLTGVPGWFTEVGRRSQDGVRTFEVWPAPDKDYACQINYGVNIQKLEDSDSNFPLIPDRYRVVLYYGAMAEMYLFQRNPESSLLMEKKFEQLFMGMLGDGQLTDSKLILNPRRGRTGQKRGRYAFAMDRSDFGRED